ncbi:uncharacterized protein LOC119957255 [Scyliorhinus canicula]|uniref:uncharacterized protein LOC119957255 n=1 Tax=Scyliorhinus canicula TaxID=7830 RepID=UPI0018F2DBE5|nr:uncharacterized protein LOC119957255 [Scyliorhinus canicula]
MESGYYSEMENVGSATLSLPEALSPYHEGLSQRTRTSKGRPSNSGRRKREFISDEKKDASYWEKRRKNNEAAKRSREKRRISDLVLENRVVALNEENVRLKSELLALKLRFGLITAAAYTEKSRQLARTSVSSYYSSYSNSPAVLLNSDSSEAEHSSRGSGFMPLSKYSPRGSLSDISDGSSSTGDSPGPASHEEVKQDEGSMDRDLMKEVMSVQVTCRGGEATSLLRSCDDIEFLNYKEPVKYNLVPRDIIQYRAQGCGEVVQAHAAQLEDFYPASAVPQASQTAHTNQEVGYTQLMQHIVSAKSLAVSGLPPSSIGVAQQSAHELPEAAMQKVQAHPLPKESVIEVLKKSPFEHSTIGSFGTTEDAHPLPPAVKDEELEQSGLQSPNGGVPRFSSSRCCLTERRELTDCPFTPCSVIEAPRVSDQGAIAPSSLGLEKMADGILSEGSDSESPEKVDSLGYEAAAQSGRQQEVRRTALPHKLRLKVRALLASEQQAHGQDHSQPVIEPGPALHKHDHSFHQNPSLGGCITRNFISVADKGDPWRTSGLLDINALPCQPGRLNNFEQCVPTQTSSHQSAPTSSGLRTANVACFTAFERISVQSTENQSLHERNHLASPTEG